MSLTLESTAAGEIRERLRSVQRRIATACQRVGRTPAEVTLMAVTKSVPAEKILLACQAGQRVFGENYVKEAIEKIGHLHQSFFEGELSFHFIGHLQRNKVKQAIGYFDLIETVDSVALGKAIADMALKKGISQKVLLQVNISHEQTKSGVLPEEVLLLAQELKGCSGIEIKGLMSIGSFSVSTHQDQTRREFQQMKVLLSELRRELNLPLTCLSMGMSEDFEMAIEEGATEVRVGSAIFGSREE